MLETDAKTLLSLQSAVPWQLPLLPEGAIGALSLAYPVNTARVVVAAALLGTGSLTLFA